MVGIATAFWLLNGLEMAVGFRVAPRLRDFPPAADSDCPKISILVPACNEEATVEAAMRSLLALDYPALEIIAIEDRSTDRTAEILNRLAAEHARLRVLHVTELPEGWLGKNHALHVGAAEATGDWLLFTDADVVFEPESLRKIAALLAARPCDHLVALPRVEAGSFWERVFIPFFMIIFHIRFRTWEAPWKWAPGYVGVGAFNMLRADVHRSLKVHERLRMEVGDDIFLGQLLKRSGYRQLMAQAEEDIHVRWAIGFRGVMQVLMKNAYAGHRYSRLSVALTLLALPFVTIWPYVGVWLARPAGRLDCAGAILCTVLIGLLFQRAWRVSWTYVFTWPLAAALFLIIIVRSAIQAERQKGIIWRGTHYSLKELRKAAK